MIGHWKYNLVFTRPENFVQSTKIFRVPPDFYKARKLRISYNFRFFCFFQSNARVLDQWAALFQRGLFCFEGKKKCVTSAPMTNLFLSPVLSPGVSIGR
ncbi:unnamed protein product [Boreogadus saida]